MLQIIDVLSNFKQIVSRRSRGFCFLPLLIPIRTHNTHTNTHTRGWGPSHPPWRRFRWSSVTETPGGPHSSPLPHVCECVCVSSCCFRFLFTPPLLPIHDLWPRLNPAVSCPGLCRTTFSLSLRLANVQINILCDFIFKLLSDMFINTGRFHIPKLLC